MKGWFVWGDPGEWGDYVHGETASQAKSMLWREFPLEIDEWINMRALRRPELDNIPITKNSLDAIDNKNEHWYTVCKCQLCRQEGRIATKIK